MRNLYLLRGVPASGKSSWVKNNNLQKITLSSDEIRLLFPQFDNTITQIYDTQVWQLLYSLMEKRMQLGQDIVIDATHYRKSFITAYEDYCDKYDYLLKVVYFDTPIEVCKERNATRKYKVPEKVIDKMYETIKANSKEIETNFTVLTPEEAIIDMEKSNRRVLTEIPIDPRNIKLWFSILRNKKEEYLDHQREDIIDVFPFMQVEYRFKQNNPWHIHDVFNHSVESLKWALTRDYIPDKYLTDELLFAILLHDIGKPFTAKVGQDGYTHFYNHGPIGSQFFNNHVRQYLTDYFEKDQLDFISEVIRKHIEPRKETDSISMIIMKFADYSSHSGWNEVKENEAKEEIMEKIRNERGSSVSQ